MPIWTELVILLLFTYAAGIGIGWVVWGRAPSTLYDDPDSETPSKPLADNPKGESAP